MTEYAEDKRMREYGTYMSSATDTRVTVKKAGKHYIVNTATSLIYIESFVELVRFFQGFEEAHKLIKLKDR